MALLAASDLNSVLELHQPNSHARAPPFGARVANSWDVEFPSMNCMPEREYIAAY
jgi:hypothetical protein